MIKIINKGPGELVYSTEFSAGFDIPSNENVTLQPGEHRVVKTGLFLDQSAAKGMLRASPVGQFIDPWSVSQLEIRPRSGLAAKHGVTVLNAPGTVDEDYPDEIGVILINHGKVAFEIKVGDRIAQGVVTSAARAEDVPVKKVKREGGFGSTGT